MSGTTGPFGRRPDVRRLLGAPSFGGLSGVTGVAGLAAMAGLAAEATPAEAPECALPGTLCNWVWVQTGSAGLARAADWFVAAPLSAALIVIGSLIVRWLLMRMLTRVTNDMSEGRPLFGLGAVSRVTPDALWEDAEGPTDERRELRAETLRVLGRNIINVAVLVITSLMVLAEFGVNLGPLIASAGIAGLAISFGAKSVIEDFISGLFMVAEDQFGVGDVIDVGEANGTVEAVTLRVTSIRDVNGVLWHVRNGQIFHVGNKSQGWARAVVDIGVGYNADIDHALEVVSASAKAFAQEEEWAKVLLESPEMWGVERMTAEGVVIREVLKTVPGEQWSVARELRERIRRDLAAAGVALQWEQSGALRANVAEDVAAEAEGKSPPSPGRPPLL